MQSFESQFPPLNARTHEVCGAAGVSFACALAGQLDGVVFWIRESWRAEQINPLGCVPFFDPRRLLLVQAPSALDVLATAEEALRSGHVALVVLEVSQPVGLTQGRRLQLAAQAGKSMGLCLIPEGQGSNAAQSRWVCNPIFDPDARGEDSTLQQWKIIKNKSGTLGAWAVNWNAKSYHVSVVSEVAQ